MCAQLATVRESYVLVFRGKLESLNFCFTSMAGVAFFTFTGAILIINDADTLF